MLGLLVLLMGLLKLYFLLGQLLLKLLGLFRLNNSDSWLGLLRLLKFRFPLIYLNIIILIYHVYLLFKVRNLTNILIYLYLEFIVLLSQNQNLLILSVFEWVNNILTFNIFLFPFSFIWLCSNFNNLFNDFFNNFRLRVLQESNSWVQCCYLTYFSLKHDIKFFVFTDSNTTFHIILSLTEPTLSFNCPGASLTFIKSI